jgi:hypothetical protein
MQRLVMSAAVGMLALTLANPVWAGRPSGCGHRFSHGYFYRGANHRHWTSRCWSRRYGCACYRCPSAHSWYYWCAPQGCYYPVSYIRMAPPCAEAAPVECDAPFVTCPPEIDEAPPDTPVYRVPCPPTCRHTYYRRHCGPCRR